MFRQLGTQLNLWRLKLSVQHLDPMAQASYLDLTLDCGLDEMSGFGKLEGLTVGSKASGIGISELEWMAQNWPVTVYEWIIHDGQPVKPGVREWLTAYCKKDHWDS